MNYFPKLVNTTTGDNMDKSYWVDSTKSTNYPTLGKNITTDVCIIGGGLVSAITGYLLTKQGIKVTILERDRVCMGVTAYSTAKLTSQHGLFYKYLESNFNFDFAKDYLDSNQEAISLAKKIIDDEHISCDFEPQDAYVFTTSAQEVEKIADEVKVVKSLGLEAEYLTKIPLPIKNILAAIKFPNQAQFNARKFALALFDIIHKNNNEIYENSKVTDINYKNHMYNISANEHTVCAKHVVMATHYPIKNFPGFYFLKMYQDKSYIIAVDTKEDLFNGMYVSSWDPVTSFRTVPYGDTRLLLVVGSEHKTGATDVPVENSFKNLENYIKNIYPNSEVKYRWSTQDCVTLDKVPYIGEFSHLLPNMYVATGFKKWGMTTSFVSAKIISDKILGKNNPYEHIYNATRLSPIKNSKEFSNMLKQSTYSLLINKLSVPEDAYNDIKLGSGGIINYNGEKIGIYKDDSGNVFAVKPYCKHLGCELSWNNLEKTWDCPCHGSRYDYQGQIINEPTTKELDKIDLKE